MLTKNLSLEGEPPCELYHLHWFQLAHLQWSCRHRPILCPSNFLGLALHARAMISPAFELGGVPVGTKHLRFTMTDLYALTFHHGGSTITYNGDSVSKGAIRYTGPCPPRGERHNYRWTVYALDSADRVLGSASAEAMFPPDGLGFNGQCWILARGGLSAPKADNWF